MVNSIVLKNASIIDGSGFTLFWSFSYKENQIDSIHREDTFSNDAEARIIDLKGKTVMPGRLMLIVICFDEPRSNDELFFIEEGLAAIIAGTNALKVLQSGGLLLMKIVSTA